MCECKACRKARNLGGVMVIGLVSYIFLPMGIFAILIDKYNVHHLIVVTVMAIFAGITPFRFFIHNF